MTKIYLTKTKEPKAFMTEEGALEALRAEITTVELNFENGPPNVLFVGADANGTQIICEHVADLIAWADGAAVHIAAVPLRKPTPSRHDLVP